MDGMTDRCKPVYPPLFQSGGYKYAHLQVMGTITGKFHQNPLKTVGGVAETRLCLRTDGLTDKWTDEPKTIVPFDLHRGTIKNGKLYTPPPGTACWVYV